MCIKKKKGVELNLIASMMYEIVKPVSCEWKPFSRCLWDVMDETRHVCNRTIQLLWEWQGYSAAYKKTNGEFPEPQHVLHKSLGGYVYNRLREEFPSLHSGNLSQTIHHVIRKWNSDLEGVSRGERSVASFKRGIPIDIHKRWIRLRKDEQGNYIATISLLSREGTKERGLSSGIFDVNLAVSDSTKKVILERVLTGVYQHTASQITHNKRKNKWFLHLTYKFEAKQRLFDPNRICGVDLGKVVVAYCAVSGSKARFAIGGGEIDKFRKGIWARRRSMLRAAKYAGDGRVGHGRSQRLAVANVLESRIANFRKTKNQKYARAIVDFAVKHGCGTIRLEDLEGINKKEKFLKDWAYYDLGQKIALAASKEGIKVERIDPAYTSQRCNQCGYIDEANREGRCFRCLSCSYETHADYNAACNLAVGDIEALIAMSLNEHEDVAGVTIDDLPF